MYPPLSTSPGRNARRVKIRNLGVFTAVITADVVDTSVLVDIVPDS